MTVETLRGKIEKSFADTVRIHFAGLGINEIALNDDSIMVTAGLSLFLCILIDHSSAIFQVTGDQTFCHFNDYDKPLGSLFGDTDNWNDGLLAVIRARSSPFCTTLRTVKSERDTQRAAMKQGFQCIGESGA
jgi:hypothetical protein